MNLESEMNKTKKLEQSRLMQQVLMLTMNKKITDLEVQCKETEKQLIKAKEQNIEYQSQIDLKNTKIANIRKQLEQEDNELNQTRDVLQREKEETYRLENKIYEIKIEKADLQYMINLNTETTENLKQELQDEDKEMEA